jgi:hypothetical protein
MVVFGHVEFMLVVAFLGDAALKSSNAWSSGGFSNQRVRPTARFKA